MERSWLALASAGALALAPARVASQELLHREGFNDDGAAANPPRYTITGGFKSEPPHPVENIDGTAADQAGPVYWARNVEVSFAGVPAPTKGRRALLVWDGALTDAAASADTLTLVANAVKWLAKDKANASVVFAPNMAAAQGLSDYLSTLGYAVADDDGTTSDTAYPADVIIKAPGSSPTRFANAPQGVVVFSALDHDDMLTSSIGVTAQFEAGNGKIEAAAHPIASGVPASFTVATGSFNWNLMGDVLPGGATTVASMIRIIPPAVTSLADVDAMAAGTKQATKASETASTLDYSDASAGDWQVDATVPGGAAGLWGLVAKGKLNVMAAGKYSFALGMDDGARLRIDKNKNGLGAEDNVVNEDATGAHRARYGDVDFTATGLYDFEVIVFNSGGGGGIEMSISTQAGGADTSAINSGTWELLGQTSGQVELSGTIAVDAYVPGGPDQETTIPMLVVLNGPTDTPPGSVFGGGPFNGFEGIGFFGGSGLNKWAPEKIADLGGYRSVRLKPVNVAGKPDLKVTVALAATFLDFETSDFLDIVAYPNGTGGQEVRLARYSAPDGTKKYFVDVQNGFINRLGLTFLDATYNVPAGATDLVIEFRSFTSWWNEIVAFDNVRITSGALSQPTLGQPDVSGGNVNLSWTGGQAPFLVQWTPSLPGPWTDIYTASGNIASIPQVGPGGFFRVQSATTKTVKLFKAPLAGANEVPAVTTPATGASVLALDGDLLTYYVYYSGLKATATLAHLHGPAAPTASASPLFNLTPVPGFGITGVLTGTRTLTAAEKGHLEGGQTYVNIHSSVHGGGEIRGQAVQVP